MASLLLAAPPAARAGSWQFTCTGSGSESGTVSYTFYGTPGGSSGSTPWTPPASATGTSFQIPSFGYGSLPGGTFGSVPTNDSQSQSVTVSPVLTVTWVPDSSLPSDPAPTSVIMTETSSASWTAQYTDGTPGVYYGGGAADDGLGDPLVKTYSGGAQLGGTDSASPAHYSTPSVSGGSVTVPRHTFTASANASLPNDGSQGSMNVGCSFGGYTLTLSVPTISLGGTMPVNGVQYGLTGQQITATLQGIPSGFKVTKYTWAGVSGTCFKTYDYTLPSNQLTPLGPTDLSGPAKGSSAVAGLAFYDSAAENVTVTCAVTLLAPDNKTTLNLTVTAPPITMEKPTLTRWDIAQGYVQPKTTQNGQGYGLYGDLSSTNLTNTNGMIWSNVMVSVPSPFSGNGQCTFTQVVNPNRLGYNGNSSQPLVPNNGILGLDRSFEYGSPWNVTAAGNDVDDPNQPIGYTGLTEISASDAFTTYVMYQPSGGVWVPLEKISWSWSATINRQTSTSPWSLTASYPATAGQAGTPTHVPISDPPQWTVVH